LRRVRAHALVQRATIEHLSPERVTTLVQTAAGALEQIWPDIERDPPLGQLLRANTTALTQRSATALWQPEGHPVLWRAGRSLGDSGLVSAAVGYWRQLTHTAEHMLGPDHPDTLTTRGNLARWRGEAGDASGAAAAFEQLLADRMRVLGPDHPHTLTTRGNLAYWRGEAGDASGAAAAFEQLLADYLRVLGPDHPHTLTTRHNLAYWRGEADGSRASH
jgi:hypothetical protein